MCSSLTANIFSSDKAGRQQGAWKFSANEFVSGCVAQPRLGRLEKYSAGNQARGWVNARAGIWRWWTCTSRSRWAWPAQQRRMRGAEGRDPCPRHSFPIQFGIFAARLKRLQLFWSFQPHDWQTAPSFPASLSPLWCSYHFLRHLSGSQTFQDNRSFFP